MKPFLLFTFILSFHPMYSYAFKINDFDVSGLEAGAYFVPIASQTNPKPSPKKVQEAQEGKQAGVFERHVASVKIRFIDEDHIKEMQEKTEFHLISEDINYCSNQKNWGGQDQVTTVTDYLTCLIHIVASIKEKKDEIIKLSKGHQEAKDKLSSMVLLESFLEKELDFYHISVKTFHRRDSLSLHKDNINIKFSFSNQDIPGHIRGRLSLLIKKLQDS